MEKYIGIFYATSSGNTKHVAELIQKELGESKTDIFDLFSIKKEKYTLFDDYDLLIFGSPTYTGGNMHFRWKKVLPFIKKLDFSERYVALFTLGDRKNYPDHFALALDQMYKELIHCHDIEILGECSAKEYHYSNNIFRQRNIRGLVLDEKNEKEMTSIRIQKWVANINKYIADWD